MFGSHIFKIKNIILPVLLILNTPMAYAQVTIVARSNDGNESYYVERSSIRREGNVVKFWLFVDNRDPEVATNRKVYFSSKTYTFFNCYNSTYRFATLIAYSKNMWEGAVVVNDQSNPDPRWFQNVPGTSIAAIFRYICG